MERHLPGDAARLGLDMRLRPFVKLPREEPLRGWLRAIRQALNISLRQLAAMMDLPHHSCVRDFEISEARGSIRLSSLRRAAQAMGCRLVYAIVPERSLEETWRERKRFVAKCSLGGASGLRHGFRTENEFLDVFAERLPKSKVWGKIPALEDYHKNMKAKLELSVDVARLKKAMLERELAKLEQEDAAMSEEQDEAMKTINNAMRELEDAKRRGYIWRQDGGQRSEGSDQ